MNFPQARLFSILASLASTAMLAAASHATIANGNADLVLGQHTFTQNSFGSPDATNFFLPVAVAVDSTSGRVFASDESNHRVLFWNNVAGLANGQPADGVLGQPDLFSEDCNQQPAGNPPQANTLCDPTGIAVDQSGNLWVADSQNFRILRFSPPFTTNMSANLVIGQANFGSFQPGTSSSSLSFPSGITVDPSGELWVSDRNNSRVLEFTPPFSNGMSASLVIGQASFTTGACNNNSLAPTANGLCGNTGLTMDPSGNLWVADAANNRTMEFTPPFFNGMNASRVIGQPDFTSSSAAGASQSAFNLAGVFLNGVISDASGNILISDIFNNRILEFSPPFSNGMNATLVIGQPDFLSSGGCNASIDFATASSLCQPIGLALDNAGSLWAADSQNFRVLRFPGPLSSNIAANLVLGQPNFQDNVQADSSNLDAPAGVAIDSTTGRLFVVDINNARILWWNNASSLVNRQPADGVLGEPDFGVIISSFVGANSLGSVTESQQPAVDGAGRLWVPDLINNRVLRYSPPFTNGMNADVVLGQPDFASNNPFLGPNGLSQPLAVTVDPAGAVWVGDSANDRVLRFSPPFTNGMNADLVLGAPNLNSSGSAGPTANAASFGEPHTLATDASGNLWVGDLPNSRILRFSPPFSNGMAANLVLGQTSFTTITSGSPNGVYPIAISVDRSGRVWVAGNQNRILRFSPPFTNGMSPDLILGQAHNSTSAAANILNSPSGVVVDTAGNVWVADLSDNRVLRFNAADSTPPTAISTLQLASVGLSSVTLSWLAPSDPDSPVSSYDIRSASFSLTSANFASATPVTGAPAPAAPGALQSVVVTGLAGQTTFFAAIESQDPAGNVSAISNVVGLVRSTTTVNGVPELTFSANQPVSQTLISTTGAQGALMLASATAQGLAVLSNIYNLGPELTTFSPPAQLSFQISTAAVASAGVLASQVALYEFFPSTGWVLVPNQSLDLVNNVISSSFTTLASIFAILAPMPAPPVAIASPGGSGLCSVVNGPVPILGSVGSRHLRSWRLEAAPGAASTTGFTLVSSGTFPVASGLLGTWNTAGLSDGQTLRLTASSPSGMTSTAAITLTVGQPALKLQLAGHPRFREPSGVAVAASGNIYVADTNADQVEIYTATGGFVAALGRDDDGPHGDHEPDLRLSHPKDVKVDAAGNIYIADTDHDRIMKVSPAGQPLLALSAALKHPSGIALDAAGTIYVSDTGHHRVVVFNADGSQRLAFGLPPVSPGSTDSDHDDDDDTASLGRPAGLAVDGSGNIYVADAKGDRLLKFSSAGVLLASYGTLGRGPAQFLHPQGVAVSSDGDCLYVSDRNNDRIQRLDPLGQPTLVSADSFNKPAGLALDAAGNLYLADRNNGTVDVLGVPAAGSAAGTTPSVPLQAAILSPMHAMGACAVSPGPVTVVGTALGARLSGWTLDAATGRRPMGGFKTILSAAAPISSGTLGVWDASQLSGWQTLRLTARDSSLGTASASVAVFIGDPAAAFDDNPHLVWPEVAKHYLKACH